MDNNKDIIENDSSNDKPTTWDAEVDDELYIETEKTKLILSILFILALALFIYGLLGLIF